MVTRERQLRFLNIDAKMPSRPLTKMMRIRKDVDVDGQQMLLVLFRSINLLWWETLLDKHRNHRHDKQQLLINNLRGTSTVNISWSSLSLSHILKRGGGNSYYWFLLLFIGPESDHWLCLSLIHWLTHWLLLNKLDYCEPGMWRWQLKSCWSFLGNV